MWRFKTKAQVIVGRRHAAVRYDPGETQDGGLWRGPSEARWIIQLLNGAPAARPHGGLLAPA